MTATTTAKLANQYHIADAVCVWPAKSPFSRVVLLNQTNQPFNFGSASSLYNSIEYSPVKFIDLENVFNLWSVKTQAMTGTHQTK